MNPSEDTKLIGAKLEQIKKHYGSGEAIDNNLVYSEQRYRRHMDNSKIPTRIETAYQVSLLLLAEQEDLRNKNETLTEYQQSQLDVIDRIISEFHNKGYSSMRTFQAFDYKLHEKEFQERFLKYSFLLVSFIFILVGLVMMYDDYKNIAMIFGILLISIYFILLYLNVRQNMMRYKYNWEKIYWKPPNFSKSKVCNKSSNAGIYMAIIGIFIAASLFGIVTVSFK